MTENKRYSFYKENDYVTFFDYSEGMNYGDVVNHLNSYADEVKAYSKQNRKLIILKNNLIEDNQRLENENEKLKQQVSEQGTQIDFLKDENKHMRDLVNENEQLKQSSTMYYNLFKELQKQMQGVKSIYDLDSKDFEDLIELSKGNVFDYEIGWIHLSVKELQE